MAATSCRHFNGYKPCILNSECSKVCASYEEVQETILLVHLGALGAVVRSTSLLKSLRRKHPKSFLIWVTEAPANQLLQNHPEVDLVLLRNADSHQHLQALNIDAAYVIDKNIAATSFVENLKITNIFGFKAHGKTGATLPATMAALELWELGLNNNKKFFENAKPETQLLVEALELGKFQRDPYSLPLGAPEQKLKASRRSAWQKNKAQIVIGFNTGCAATIPAKKWTADFQLQVIQQCFKFGFENIVLLGGPEDEKRNAWLHQQEPRLENSPTALGLRDGLVSVAACDLVVTGDSLGLHMALSQRVYTVAWFGPTVANEIDLFDRGEKLVTSMPCSPCWKSFCGKEKMCYDSFKPDQILEAILRGVQFCQIQSPKESLSFSPHFSETLSLV